MLLVKSIEQSIEQTESRAVMCGTCGVLAEVLAKLMSGIKLECLTIERDSRVRKVSFARFLLSKSIARWFSRKKVGSH